VKRLKWFESLISVLGGLTKLSKAFYTLMLAFDSLQLPIFAAY